MKFYVALSDSLLAECSDLREKTIKLGIISRAISIFRVERVNIYRDLLEAKGEYDLIEKILKYQNTPQYLRKRLFLKEKELKFAGLLPPLRTPHHKLLVPLKEIKEGEVRQGYSFKKGGKFYVDLGLEKIFPLEDKKKEEGIVNVKFFGRFPNLYVKKIDKSEIKDYWGYEVKYYTSLKSLLSSHEGSFLLLTSKYGKDISQHMKEIIDGLRSKNSLLLVFGSPRRGLFEIMRKEGINIKDYEPYIYNTLPDQGVETVRVEEALISTLAILNLIRKLLK
ncbi:MAG: putative RNA uridine N3 methyltransferase [Nitrososphaerales archaeon]